MITIRMYNVGLGDCFLLRFKAPGRERDRFMLIDCGLFRGSDAEKETLQAVVEDIAKTTKGRLDVVVATHEHQDHLSGFWYAQAIFKEKIKIDKVWLAWTERPGEPRARQLKDKIDQFSDQLTETVNRLGIHLDETKPVNNRRQFSVHALQSVGSVLDFLGFDTDDSVPQNAPTNPPTVVEQPPKKKLSINRKALNYLQEVAVPPENIVYHEPDTTTTLDGLPNIRVYILGPPRSDLIKQSDPSKRNPEVYNFAGNDRSNYAMMLPAWSGNEEEDRLDQLDRMPFEPVYYTSAEAVRIPVDTFTDDEETVKRKVFFQHYYTNEKDERNFDQGHRKIDDDWLFSLGNLALQLDGDTNNTSLALAIELIDTKRVLLFPGDAQVGNWLSWHDCKWEHPDTKDVTTAKLLERTVFYKVGHHGSHNATLRDKGLELMQSPDLVAMIPLDEAVAKQKDWKMPFGSLYASLAIKTKGRILQADGILSPAAVEAAKLRTEDDEQAYTSAVKHSKARRPTANNIDRPLWTEFILR